MSKSLTCPTADVLEQLLQGRLSDEESELLEQHLLSCEDCQRQTREMNPADTMADALRKQAAQPVVERDSHLLREMMERLQDRSLIGTQISAIEGTHISGASAGDDDAADLTDFLPTLRPAEAADELGRLGEFRLLTLLGHGGMGAVFLAEDVRLKRRVALKVLRPEFAKKKDAAERFLREAQAAAAVRHDNVVTIFQVGEDNSTPFMAQELLHGESLKDCLDREGTLPIAEVLRIGGQIADGLSAAHAHGLLHRDIKPANVWLEGAEGRGLRGKGEDNTRSTAVALASQPLALSRVKILDFGLARLEESDAQITHTGVILGTPAYMSPEQASAEAVDARTDLFSLGVVLYRMATGRQPFEGKTTTAVLKAVAVDQPPAPEQLRSEISKELSDLILRLLEKDRTRRPKSAVEVSRELTKWKQRNGEAPAEPRTVPPHDGGKERTVVFPATKIPLSFEEIAQWPTEPIPRKQPVGKSARSPRRVARVVTGMASVILLAIVIVTVKSKGGKTTKVAVNVPDDAVSAKAKLQKEKKSKGGSVPKPAFTGPSPFDELDPAAIPAEERFAWQPKGLVAVLGSHRQRLWAGAASAALSGDGALALVAGHDGKGLLLDTVNGKELVSPVPLSRSVAVSPDGTMLFWNQANGQLGLMVRDGESWTAREMGLPKGVVLWGGDPWDATFSLDGRWLATSILHEVLDGLAKYSTYVWDVSVNPPQRIVELHGHKHPSFSPDGRRLAVIATHDGSHTLQVFDLSELPSKRHAVVPGIEFPSDYRSTVRPRHGFLASGKLAAIDKTGLLAVWDVSTAEPKLTAKRELSKTQGSVSVTGYSGFSLRPFRTGSDRILLFTEPGFQTWRLNDDGLELEFDWASSHPGHDGFWVHANLTDVGISTDGKTLASTHINGMVRLWTLTENGFREKHPIRPQPIHAFFGRRSIVIAPDGKHFVSNSEDGFQVWRLNGTACQRLACTDTMGQIDGPISFVSPSQFTTVGNGIAHQWKIDGDRVVSQGKLAEWLSPVTAGSEGLVISRVRDSVTEFSLTELSLWQTGQVPAKRLVTWKVASPGRQIMFNAHSGAFAISQDNRLLVTTDHADDGAGNNVNWTIRLWQRSDENSVPSQVASIPAGASVFQIAVSPDSQRLAIADQSGVSLWLIKDNRPLQLWHRTGQCNTVAFTPDGENVAASFGNSGSETESCKIVLLSRNGELLYSHNRAITNEFDIPFPPSDLAFTPDGRHLITANSNGTVYILRLQNLAEHSQPKK